MDSNTLQLLGAGALIVALAIIALISKRLEARKAKRLASGELNPLPKTTLIGVSREDVRATTAFVLTQVEDFNQIAWGADAATDRREAERLYQSALDALTDAEGDYRKFSPVLETLMRCPRDLALSGVAEIITRLSYFHDDLYAPKGVQAALTYTSAAIEGDPLSVDAWIARLLVACAADDRAYRIIADGAMEKIRALNPNHPRFPNAESAYYRLRKNRAQYEVALKRMIALAPSPLVKRAGYDRLARLYGETGRRQEAIDTYQQLFREQPQGSAWTWHNYSLQLLAAKRYQEALDASDRALAFFEFDTARRINNKARSALGMPVSVGQAL